MVPMPLAPLGALAIHGRPLPLLSEMPSGRLADGRSLVAACGSVTLLSNGGLCAAYTCTAPSSAEAWPPAAAKSAGTTAPSALGSIGSIEPSGSF
jgi:hypothetical protein